MAKKSQKLKFGGKAENQRLAKETQHVEKRKSDLLIQLKLTGII